MAQVTVSGGGLKEALTITVTDSPAAPAPARDLSPLLREILKKLDVPRDPSGVPYSKPSVTGTAG